MLFNSNIFIFAFLPIALSIFYLLGSTRRKAAGLWLVLCSLVFYAWWNPPFVLILLGSASVNFLLSTSILANQFHPRQQFATFWFAAAANLGLLCYFKYLFPLLSFLQSFGIPEPAENNVILPLGISFFTFTQLGYLVDCKQGLVKESSLINYLLFVTFFPHLIAGPILHHREIMPQFAASQTYRFKPDSVSVGLTMFVMGLAKKVLLADSLAHSVEAGFDDPQHLAFLASWAATLAYSLQIYFDFSGYSDMALGLARMFGVRFPINFNSPYKAASIIDFWQRWHMTLTRYLTLYLYNPVAMYVTRWRAAQGYHITRDAASNVGGFATLILLPTFYTMLLAGIWHGAGLQFVIFGLLHGCYLSVNHAWRVFGRRDKKHAPLSRLRTACYVLITFIAVLVAQVFFRADSVGSALSMLAGMIGAHGIETNFFVPDSVVTRLGAVGAFMLAHGIVNVGRPELLLLFVKIGVFLAIVLAMPNTQQILAGYSPSLGALKASRVSKLQWQPNLYWAIVLGCLFIVSIFGLQTPARFLYFQF
jgi:alginate O-acetyltransferase complex protein AlgI